MHRFPLNSVFFLFLLHHIKFLFAWISLALCITCQIHLLINAFLICFPAFFSLWIFLSCVCSFSSNLFLSFDLEMPLWHNPFLLPGERPGERPGLEKDLRLLGTCRQRAPHHDFSLRPAHEAGREAGGGPAPGRGAPLASARPRGGAAAPSAAQFLLRRPAGGWRGGRASRRGSACCGAPCAWRRRLGLRPRTWCWCWPTTWAGATWAGTARPSGRRGWTRWVRAACGWSGTTRSRSARPPAASCSAAATRSIQVYNTK